MKFIRDIATPGIIIVMIILGIILLMSVGYRIAVKNCIPSNQEIIKSEWVKIAPPPGEDGPCYAFFYNNKLSRVYKGVWCK